MVLLHAKNYDYSEEQQTTLLVESTEGATILKFENPNGFAVADYFVLNPQNENAEIFKISAISDNEITTTLAADFIHYKNEKIYRLSYNQIKFYESEDNSTFTEIVGSETDIDYTSNFTNYNYTAATSGYYYKRVFYNETTDTESDIDQAESWLPYDEELYATPEELRMFLQFEPVDYPTPKDMAFFIRFAQKRLALDLESTSAPLRFIGTLLLAKAYVLRGLATRAVSKGYVQANAEGRTITKAYQELVLEAENTEQEYKAFLLANGRQEATRTNFLDDTTMIDDATRQNIINMMNGETNVEDFTRGYRFWYYDRKGYRS